MVSTEENNMTQWEDKTGSGFTDGLESRIYGITVIR